MPLFVVTAIDKENSLPLRLATREAHFAYAQETGVIRLGGPFLGAKEEMAGSLIIFEAADLERSEGLARGRPLCEGGPVRAFRGAAVETDLQFDRREILRGVR